MATSAKPLVSVLIPTFNQNVEHLRACIESAVTQDYEHIEVVVSDNHSTGPAAQFLSEFRHPRLRVVKPPTFVKMTENFAFCGLSAKGEFLSFLSSDDVLVDNAISNLVPILAQHPDIAFCCGNVMRGRDLPLPDSVSASLIRPSTQPSRIYTAREAETFFFPWGMSSTWIPGDLIRRQAYERTGGFDKCTLDIISDIWLARNLLLQGGFAYYSGTVAFYRARPTNSAYVDPTRYLRELTDEITLRATTADLPPAGRINRLMHHLYLIDRLPSPNTLGMQDWDRAIVAFRTAKRADLARATQVYRRRQLVWRILRLIVSPLLRLKAYWNARQR